MSKYLDNLAKDLEYWATDPAWESAEPLIAHARELESMLAEFKDYLIESYNNVLSSPLPRYERQRQTIQADIDRLDALLTKGEQE